MNQNKKKRIIITAVIVVILAAIVGFVFFQQKNKDSKDNENVNTNVENETEDSEEFEVPDINPEDYPADAYKDPTQPIDVRVEVLLSQMTLEEKVAQMMQPEQAYISASQVKEYGIGTVLSGGGSAPSSGNTIQDWQARINELKQAALDSRLGIPLLYGVDAVHGNNNVYGATIFPHNIGLGAANDPELMTAIGEVVAQEVKAMGAQWTFAPTLGNPQNEFWGRTYECFSEDASDVTKISEPLIVGFQGDPQSDEYLDSNHVLATAKHYIGEGYTLMGINQGNVKMEEEEFDVLLHDELLEPYKAAIDAGTMTVMVSYNSVDGLKCHENSYLINDVLKGELNFQGLVISDYNGVQQIKADTYKEQIALAVNSGVDVLMEVSSWEECMDLLIDLVNEGEVSNARIDDAVRRILRVKFMAGLFEKEIGGENEQQLIEAFGSDEHRAVARQAVSESLVLLKNDEVGGTLALDSLVGAKSILVVGKKADDIGSQCGGWTISWQGMSGDITEGTTILEAIQEAVGNDVTVDFSEDGVVSKKYDAIVMVVGEIPYAEVNGDRTKDNLMLTKTEQALFTTVNDNAAAAGCEDAPVVTILLSGRPIKMSNLIDQTDALVMAWLPGTEGAGITDVLFGEKDFTGTLTYTWPEEVSDVNNKFDAGIPILFEKGFGLNKAGIQITK